MKPSHFTTTKDCWMHMLSDIQEPDNEYVDQDGRHCSELTNVCITIDNPGDASDVIRELQRQPHWVYPTPEELRIVLFNAHGTEQLDTTIIPLLREKPESRRAVAVLYEPKNDLYEGQKTAFLTIHFRILDGKLQITSHVRSCDILLGLPANIFQLFTMQEYVAKALGLPIGALHSIISSAHYFTEYDELLPVMAKVIKKNA